MIEAWKNMVFVMGCMMIGLLFVAAVFPVAVWVCCSMAGYLGVSFPACLR